MSTTRLGSIGPTPSMPDAPKMPDAPIASHINKGNTQVEGSVVHTNTLAERKAALQAQIDELKRQEAKSIAGAPVLTPKERLLDVRDLEMKEPNKHFRFVNTSDAGKVSNRILEGYEKVPESEGGRSLGELSLFKQPREKFEERVARQNELTKQRERAHVHEVEQAVEGVARFLRDRYGLRVDPNRMIIKE